MTHILLSPSFNDVRTTNNRVQSYGRYRFVLLHCLFNSSFAEIKSTVQQTLLMTFSSLLLYFSFFAWIKKLKHEHYAKRGFIFWKMYKIDEWIVNGCKDVINGKFIVYLSGMCCWCLISLFSQLIARKYHKIHDLRRKKSRICLILGKFALWIVIYG